jgi:exonuclease III
MVKLLSWNIQAGGGSRILLILKKIKESNSNIVTLSEFRNNAAGLLIRNGLLKAGFRYQAVTDSKPNDNSVIIASKIPFSSRLYPMSDPNYSGNIVTAEFSAFNLMGVYMPHKKKHLLFQAAQEAVSISPMPFIIAGDFNSGKNYIDQKGNSFWYTEELVKLEQLGMIDAFRYVNEDVEEYSWYSHQKNGFRYDHIYCSSDLKTIIKNCCYNHSWRIDKLSDHSPMFLEMG